MSKPWDLGPRIIDFSPLASLGKQFIDGYQSSQKIGLERDRRVALSELGASGNVDPRAVSGKLMALGDVDGGLAAMRLADQQQQRTFQQGMAERQFGFQEKEAARSQGNADRSFGASREDRSGDLRFRDLQQSFQQTQANRSYELQREQANRREVPPGFQPAPGGALQPTPGGPQDPDLIRRQTEARNRGEPKPLSDKAVGTLGEAGSNLSNAKRFGETFRDEYAGWGNQTVGNIAGSIARNSPFGNKDAASWWQDYDRYKNVTRNQLFGSALTKPEAEAFEKADINPGMDPKIVKRNIEIQKSLALSAAKKLAGVYNAQGKSAEEIEAATGFPLAELGITAKRPAAPARSAPATSAPAAPAQGEQWTEGAYQYRRLPDGRVQRRAIQQ